MGKRDIRKDRIRKRDVTKRVVLLCIILYVFLLSIQLMSGSFKMFGKGFAESIIPFTTNPLVGLFIGILATSIVQSSSVTTSIIVGLAASGALTITNAIPIIMGANIGTSITSLMVSLAHITRKEEFRKAFEVATVHDFFNFIVVLILLPLEVYFHILEKTALFLTQFFVGSNMNLQFTSPLSYVIKPVASFIQVSLLNNAIVVLIVSLILLFFSLKYFVDVIKPLAESKFKVLLEEHVFKTPIRSFSFGLILTVVVQSSSVTTSLLVPLAAVGILTLEKLFPFVLGANVGTTFTALLASLVTGSPAGIAVAFVHILFNTFGAAIVYPFRKIPLGLSKWIAHLSFHHRIVPFVYVASAFYILPGFVIFVLH